MLSNSNAQPALGGAPCRRGNIPGTGRGEVVGALETTWRGRGGNGADVADDTGKPFYAREDTGVGVLAPGKQFRVRCDAGVRILARADVGTELRCEESGCRISHWLR